MFIINMLNFVFFCLDLQYKITTDTEVGRNFVFKKAKETVRSRINKLIHNQIVILSGHSIMIAKGFFAHYFNSLFFHIYFVPCTLHVLI